MRPNLGSALALLTVLLLAGCESNVRGKIEGTKWSSLSMTVNGRTISDGFLYLEFAKNGKVFYRAGTVKVDGTYSLGWGGDTVTFNLDREIAGRKTHNETVVITDNKLTMTDSDGTTVTFRRVN
jgi:hypothetical protein